MCIRDSLNAVPNFIFYLYLRIINWFCMCFIYMCRFLTNIRNSAYTFYKCHLVIFKNLFLLCMPWTAKLNFYIYCFLYTYCFLYHFWMLKVTFIIVSLSWLLYNCYCKRCFNFVYSLMCYYRDVFDIQMIIWCVINIST